MVQSLVEAVLARQMAGGSLTVVTGDEPRACLICGGEMRVPHPEGTCRDCRRAHLSIKRCRCGCGEHLDQRTAIEGYRQACFWRLAVAVAVAARHRGLTLIGVIAGLEREQRR